MFPPLGGSNSLVAARSAGIATAAALLHPPFASMSVCRATKTAVERTLSLANEARVAAKPSRGGAAFVPMIGGRSMSCSRTSAPRSCRGRRS